MKIKNFVILIAFFFTLFFLSIYSFAGEAQAKHRETIMGDFSVPHLSGWKPDVYRGDHISSIKYRTEVDKTKLRFKFSYVKTPKGLKVPTAASLRQNEMLNQKVFKQMNNDARINITFKTLSSQPTRFRGWPAYVTVVRSSSKKPANNSITNTKILKFVDGKNEYWFSISLSGKSQSPKAKKVAETAWNKITMGLKSRK